MKYRPEIDGLRALAVLPVILFHAGFEAFGGGYVGVDVFFVISGYLITTIIVDELRRGSFSIVRFYERRARRILPALFLVAAVCILLAWYWMTPAEMKAFGQSLVAMTLFGSNILFWRTSGYFENTSELKPLLHTWSLAVEEQFYVLFPLFLMLGWRFGRRVLMAAMLVLALASLWWSQSLLVDHLAMAYYLLPARAWELLVGAFVAFYLDRRHGLLPNRAWREAASIAGLALLAYGVFAFDEFTPFPGFAALVPTLGTAALILCARPDTAVGRLLGMKAVVGVGLISYSAYLWHQPLLAFARLRAFSAPGKPLLAALCMLSLLLAYLTWKFVETPIRQRKTISRGQLFGASAAIGSCLLGVGLAAHLERITPLWQLAHPGLVNTGVGLTSVAQRPCVGMAAPRDGICRVYGHGSRRVVIWGDSHALALAVSVPVLDDVELVVLSQPGCPPLIGVRRLEDPGAPSGCSKLSALEHYADYVASLKPDTVLLAGRWTLYLHGLQFEGVASKRHHYLSESDTGRALPSLAERETVLARALRRTVSRFSAQSQVLVLAQVPDFASYGFRRIARQDFAEPLSALSEWHRSELRVLAGLSDMPNTHVIDPKPVFCDSIVCATRDKGVLLYQDENHLSPAGGAKLWREVLAQRIFGVLRQPHPAS